jgi:hypothetical protein
MMIDRRETQVPEGQILELRERLIRAHAPVFHVL